MTGTKKHKRSNRDRWDKAWALVQFWYSAMAKEGAVTYTVSGQKVAVAVTDDYSERDTLAQAKKDRPENWRSRRDEAGVVTLTADGRERRYILPQQAEKGFWGVDTDLDVWASELDDDGNRIYRAWTVPLEPRINYAREAMRHVARLCREAHMVLEMRAATWDFPAIAAEIGCADPTARQYFSEGIGVIMCYQDMVKPGRI